MGTLAARATAAAPLRWLQARVTPWTIRPVKSARLAMDEDGTRNRWGR